VVRNFELPLPSSFSNNLVPTSPNDVLCILHRLIRRVIFLPPSFDNHRAEHSIVYAGNGALDSVNLALERRTSFEGCGSCIAWRVLYQRAKGTTNHAPHGLEYAAGVCVTQDRKEDNQMNSSRLRLSTLS
jgi:hypothetical protein